MASGYVMTVNGLERSKTLLRKWATEAPNAVVQAMATSAQQILVPAIQQAIRDNGSIFRGQLHQRVAVRSSIKGTTASIDVGSLGVPYGRKVEEGTRGRGMEEGELEKLVEYGKKKMGLPTDIARRVALAIRRTIESSGNQPHPFLAPTWDAQKDAYVNDVAARLRARGFTS